MKKSTPWAEQHAEAERQIRADERAKVLALYEKRQTKIYELASEILALSGAIEPPKPVANAEPAPKRAATVASQEQMDEALTILRNVRPPDEPLTPKQVAGTWSKGYGGKISAAAALRGLVKAGDAVEVKRGKFKAIIMSDGDGQVQTTEA